MSLSSIDDGRMQWLWMEGVVASLHLGSGSMYPLIRRNIYLAKSCIGEREREREISNGFIS